MPDTVKVRRKQGAGAVRHLPGWPLLDDNGDALLVEEGTVIEVPSEIAGKAPKGELGNKSYDPGEGLLAQTDVWEPGPKSVAAKNDPPEEG